MQRQGFVGGSGLVGALAEGRDDGALLPLQLMAAKKPRRKGEGGVRRFVTYNRKGQRWTLSWVGAVLLDIVQSTTEGC